MWSCVSFQLVIFRSKKQHQRFASQKARMPKLQMRPNEYIRSHRSAAAFKKRNIYEYREGESDESFIFNNVAQIGSNYNKKPKEPPEGDSLCPICQKTLHNEEICVPKCKHVHHQSCVKSLYDHAQNKDADKKKSKTKSKANSERDIITKIEDSSKYSALETGECPICSTYIADKMEKANRIRFVTKAEIRTCQANKLESQITTCFDK